jgi:hypothetical protein
MTRLQQGFVTGGMGSALHFCVATIFRIEIRFGSEPAFWQLNVRFLPPKADIAERDRHVRFVPKADILAAVRYA